MNRLSELQTIVKVANICNKNGLIKEADQLLNIFTKLAQENTDSTDTVETSEIEENTIKSNEPANTESTEKLEIVDQDLVNKIHDFIESSEQLYKDLIENTTLNETKRLLPELTRLIYLDRVILADPNLEPENKKALSESLQELIKIQQTLTI